MVEGALCGGGWGGHQVKRGVWVLTPPSSEAIGSHGSAATFDHAPTD